MENGYSSWIKNIPTFLLGKHFLMPNTSSSENSIICLTIETTEVNLDYLDIKKITKEKKKSFLFIAMWLCCGDFGK